ncbi:hypothetical protein DCAR_0207475 [Daucus carota subsp. sativus]|uniref:Uncharacterized protein n=1 Tax=Daucus carota subsp. sativus TaxID=79200 RepID=A0A166DXE8_DAUCS|nr:hypothetical protein DCAR_0207475 [Daucus carota subsp. sativus]
MASHHKIVTVFLIMLVAFSFVVSIEAAEESKETFGSLNPFKKAPGKNFMPGPQKEEINTEAVGHMNPFKKDARKEQESPAE